ncbi:MAG: hypothetical protein KDD11_05895 [Acidobacteria bacterium]|nr:hypothetical protein [Acidobacteriota bacterium]
MSDPGSTGWTGFFTRPFSDAFHGLDRCLDGGGRALVWVALGLALGWWIYVPFHELLHALACVATGGSVSELQISPLYGGSLLEGLVPWVVSGGEYAGRLSGFDTHGSDAIYLATDFGPYLLTLFPGVWWLRRAGATSKPLLFGASLPVALAPFASLPGDAYEIGSILVTHAGPWSSAAARALLRGDDVGLRFEALRAASSGAGPWIGFALAFLAGALWAWCTYAAGGWISRRLGAPPLAHR